MYQLPSSQRITKELLLSKYTQEQFFEYYLGMPVKKGLFCSSPLIRVDKKPTCSFYKNKAGVLKYKDFAGPTFDFVGLVMFLHQCSYYKALQIIAKDFGFIETTELPTKPIIPYSGIILEETSPAKIDVVTKEFSKKELLWWESFGISASTLQKFKVFSIKTVFLNDKFYSSSTESSPIYGYYGGKNSAKLDLWRIYMPTKVKYRFLSNWNATMLQGAKQLVNSGEFLVITKSLKDVMALYEFEIPAIAPVTENLFLTRAQYYKLSAKFNKLFLLYDRDLPGVKAAQKIRKMFPEVTILLMPKTKDFTDYVKKYGVLKTINLINTFKQTYDE